MARIAASFLALLLWFFPVSASAQEQKPPSRSVELQGLAGPMGPLFLAFGPKYDQFSTRPVAIMFAARIRPKRVYLGFEVNMVMPAGFGMNVLFDVYRGDRFRLHLVDPGVFLNALHPLSVARIKRSYDVTVGAGGEVFLGQSRKISVGFDWRVYLPDPWAILTAFSGFSRPIYNEAAQGGYVCVLFTFRS